MKVQRSFRFFAFVLVIGLLIASCTPVAQALTGSQSSRTATPAATAGDKTHRSTARGGQTGRESCPRRYQRRQGRPF